jgi:hypothetical protein
MKQVETTSPPGLKIIREPSRNNVTRAGVEELREAGASERLLKHAERALSRTPDRDPVRPPNQ